MLPAELVGTRLALQLLRVWSGLLVGVAGGAPIFRRVLQAPFEHTRALVLRGPSRAGHSLENAVHLSRALAQNGDAQTLAELRQALPSVEEVEGIQGCRAALHVGYTYVALGTLLPAQAAFARAYALGQKRGDLRIAFAATVSLLDLDRQAGQLEHAALRYEQVLNQFAASKECSPM